MALKLMGFSAGKTISGAIDLVVAIGASFLELCSAKEASSMFFSLVRDFLLVSAKKGGDRTY